MSEMNLRDKIFVLLGVEPNEEFKLRDKYGEVTEEKYKINEWLTPWVFDEDQRWTQSFGLWFGLFEDNAEIVKNISPTEKEQLAIDYARACGYEWLAKDSDGTVYAYKGKPYKSSECYSWEMCNWSEDGWTEINIDISFIQWEDKEPYYIGD